MRLTKKEFMEGLKKYQEMVQKNDKVVSVLGSICELYSDDFLEAYLNLFRNMCDIIDEDNTYANDLDYFIYDLEFGTKWHYGCCSANDKEYRLQTIEDVWKALKDEPVFVNENGEVINE